MFRADLDYVTITKNASSHQNISFSPIAQIILYIYIYIYVYIYYILYIIYIIYIYNIYIYIYIYIYLTDNIDNESGYFLKN